MSSLLSDIISTEDIRLLALSENLSFDDEERISILKSMRSIDVQACPGSGKTTLIAAKLILLAKKWSLSGQGICVLSHTNVAKNEIVERLKNSKIIEAQRLLSYPHFIGTIQEFVNKFLALPIIRQSGKNVQFLEGDDGYKEVLYSGEKLQSLYSSLFRKCGGTGKPWPLNQDIYDKIMKFLGSLFWLNSEQDIAFYGAFGSLNTYKNDTTKKVFPMLKSLKESIEKNGKYQYRDMFVFARQLLINNKRISSSLQNRFPLVFIDEMQDTQAHQDEILCEVFPLDSSEIIVQRFGDPDQAIFHGGGNEEPNISFNSKSTEEMDFVVDKSHRFDAELAAKIKPLSYNCIPLESELTEEKLDTRSHANSNGGVFEHSVIIFNDDTRNRVIQTFGNIVSEQFSEEYKCSNNFNVKALGAVGNEIDPEKEQLKIGHYWDDYEKSKAKNNFKESSLIEAVRYCRQLTSSDFSESYKLLFNCILKLLWLAKCFDEEGRRYTKTSLRDSLKAEDNFTSFRKTLYLLLSDIKPLNQKYWLKVCEILTAVFDLESLSKEASQYLDYNEEPIANVVQKKEKEYEVEENKMLIPLPENKIKHPDGFDIHLSTIHGVKGETHDATLVMETKYRSYDIGVLLNHITGLDQTRIKQKTKTKFTRQLYVAASRPRHLLCLAIHEDRILKGQREAMEKLGWCFNDLSYGDSDG